MKNRNLLKFAFLFSSCFILIACSEDNTLPSPPTPLNITLDKYEITPLEEINASVNIEYDDIKARYDSIIWDFNGFYGDHSLASIALGQSKKNSTNLSLTDYRLGKNSIHLYGYKDGKIIEKTSAEYNVTKPTKDFFLLKWVNEEKKSNRDHYSSDEYMSKYKIYIDKAGFPKWSYTKVCLSYINESNKHQYAILSLEVQTTNSNPELFYNFLETEETRSSNTDFDLPNIDDYDFSPIGENYNQAQQKEIIQLTRNFLHLYITKIYGKSILKYEGEDIRNTNLSEEYNKRFKKPLEKSIYVEEYPVEIWTTPTTNICLYAQHNGWYFIIAEPK